MEVKKAGIMDFHLVTDTFLLILIKLSQKSNKSPIKYAMYL